MNVDDNNNGDNGGFCQVLYDLAKQLLNEIPTPEYTRLLHTDPLAIRPYILSGSYMMIVYDDDGDDDVMWFDADADAHHQDSSSLVWLYSSPPSSPS